VIDGKEVAFKVESHTTMYHPHYRAYILESTPIDINIVWRTDLFTSGTVHIRTSHIYELSNSFVLLPFALYTI